MKRTKRYYEILGRLDERKVLPDDVDAFSSFVFEFMTLQRLAKKHHRLAEMDCNGEGIVNGVHYYGGAIDDYARRQYGAGVKSAYIKDDVSIFDIEAEKIQDKIELKCKALGLSVEFQGDPRGATVRIKARDRDLTDILFD